MPVRRHFSPQQKLEIIRRSCPCYPRDLLRCLPFIPPRPFSIELGRPDKRIRAPWLCNPTTFGAVRMRPPYLFDMIQWGMSIRDYLTAAGDRPPWPEDVPHPAPGDCRHMEQRGDMATELRRPGGVWAHCAEPLPLREGFGGLLYSPQRRTQVTWRGASS